MGTVDIEADSAVIWHGPAPKGEPVKAPGELFVEDGRQPMEVYLEGNVILRQDENKFAGKERPADLPCTAALLRLSDRPDAGAHGRDRHVRSVADCSRSRSSRRGSSSSARRCSCPTGRSSSSEHPEIRAERPMMTGSRFPNPGY